MRDKLIYLSEDHRCEYCGGLFFGKHKCHAKKERDERKQRQQSKDKQK